MNKLSVNSRTPVLPYSRTPVLLCLLLLVYTFDLLAEDCSFKNLPKCDSKNFLVPQNYPSQIVYIQSLSLDEIVQVAKTMGDTPTRLQVSSDEYKKIKEKAKKDPAYAQAIKLNRFYVPKSGELSMRDGASGYAREGVFYGFDSSKKSVVLKAVTNSDDPPGGKVCGLKIKRNILKYNEKQSGNSNFGDYENGSHILAIPGGTCLASNLTNKDFVRSICGSEAKIIPLDTSDSRIDAIDELFNIVPNLNNKCGFSVVSSSTARGLDVLRKNPEGLLYSESGIQLLPEVRKKNPLAGKMLGVCAVIRKFKYLKKIQDRILQKNNKNDSVKGITKLFDKIIKRAMASEISNEVEEIKKWESSAFPDLGVSTEKPSDAVGTKISDCANFRNKDYLELFSYEDNLGSLIQQMQDNMQVYGNKVKEKKCDKENISFRDTECGEIYNVNYRHVQTMLADIQSIVRSTKSFQETQDINWQKIKKSLPSGCQEDQIKIDLPVIIGSHGMSNPIPTDLVVAGHSAVVPLQINEAFSKDISSLLKQSGLDTVYIDTMSAHEAGANVHSRSNEVRLCQP